MKRPHEFPFAGSAAEKDAYLADLVARIQELEVSQ